MNIRFAHIAAFAAVVFAASCKNAPSKNHGPIVLGDSSTIITENDPDKLHDLVTEMQPVAPPPEDTTPAPVATTAKPDTAKKATTTATAAPQPAMPAGAGLTAAFKQVTVMVPGLMAKITGDDDLSDENGAVYTWTGGPINGSSMRVNGNVTKVSQRYISVVIIRTGNGMLPLESLTSTTAWAPMKGGNGMYPVTGLSPDALEYPKANNAAIRNAVKKAAQRHRLSHKKTEDWMDEVENVRAANQRPLTIALRSVMWKIDGKDEKGKMYSKQIRVDMPM